MTLPGGVVKLYLYLNAPYCPHKSMHILLYSRSLDWQIKPLDFCMTVSYMH